MPQFIGEHSFAAICLILLLQEAGIPLPFPTDLLILMAGALAADSALWLGIEFAILLLVSSIGASVFFVLVRRGGRPLVERFGRYIHIGPAHLARSEAWLARRGWLGIALGRAIPLVRLPVAVACGLLNVSYPRYLSAQVAGSAVYIALLLVLGATVGPTVIEALHLPQQAVRLIWLLLLAAGLPALLWRLSVRVDAPGARAPVRWQLVRASVLASIAGTIALSATWAAGTTSADLLGNQRSLDLSFTIAEWLIGRGLRAGTAYAVVYSGLLAICVALGGLYDALLRPRIALGPMALARQALGLTVLSCGLLGLVLAPALAAPQLSFLREWWSAGDFWLPLVLLLGLLSFAVTAVCGHNLAVAMLSSPAPVIMDKETSL